MTQQLVPSRLRLSRVVSVPDGARIRHFDELDDPSQDFVARVAAGEDVAGESAELFDGDVVVFTGYFSVSAA